MSYLRLSAVLFLAAAACGSTEIDPSSPADTGNVAKNDGGEGELDGSLSDTDGGTSTTTDGGTTTTTDGGGGQGSGDAGLGAYADAEVQESDAGCVPEACTTPASGCGTAEVCNDGLDNNCNGQVDEYCGCSPGTVQPCFIGPPGRRGRGTCADGQQTCQGAGELGGAWSPCVGGISPSAELCDDADNDCDGCKDDGLCCEAAGSCPSNDDPRVPVRSPFQMYTLQGADFFFGSAKAWQWKVEGGPCDRMLFASKRVVSYAVTGAAVAEPRVTALQNLSFKPTLSGDYTITLRVTQTDDTFFECTFLARVRQPGMRVETCWDTTGQDDVDLWVHNPGNQNTWGLKTNDATCFYANCLNTNANSVDWNYDPTANGACREPVNGACKNPRLDIDNVQTAGVPENINVDVPNDGDSFRVALNFFDKKSSGDVHPMVNLYCGGALKATFGGAEVNGTLYGSNAISGFNTEGGNTSGSLWRVADVKMQEPADTCQITPLVPTNGSGGACVATGTDRSFSGPCKQQ